MTSKITIIFVTYTIITQHYTESVFESQNKNNDKMFQIARL